MQGSSGKDDEKKPAEYADWIEDAVAEFAKKGGFDDLVGKGKPLKLEEGDAFTGVLKHANFVPAWVALRKEIAGDMQRFIERSEAEPNADLNKQLDEINQKIRKHNRLVPSGALQRGLVTGENIKWKYEHWR